MYLLLSVCKQTCSESNNCNNRKPEVFKENLKCFVCEETKNHLNQTIGFSDTGKDLTKIERGNFYF